MPEEAGESQPNAPCPSEPRPTATSTASTSRSSPSTGRSRPTPRARTAARRRRRGRGERAVAPARAEKTTPPTLSLQSRPSSLRPRPFADPPHSSSSPLGTKRNGSINLGIFVSAAEKRFPFRSSSARVAAGWTRLTDSRSLARSLFVAASVPDMHAVLGHPPGPRGAHLPSALHHPRHLASGPGQEYGSDRERALERKVRGQAPQEPQAPKPREGRTGRR